MALFYALLHAVPVVLAGMLFRNSGILNVAAAVMVLVAVFGGSLQYMFPDLLAVGVAWFVSRKFITREDPGSALTDLVGEVERRDTQVPDLRDPGLQPQADIRKGSASINDYRDSRVQGDDLPSANDDRAIKWFWGSFAFLVVIWTTYMLWDPVPSSSDVINDVFLVPDDPNIDPQDISKPAGDKEPRFSDSASSDTVEDTPDSVEKNTGTLESRSGEPEVFSDVGYSQVPNAHIQSPTNEASHVEEDSPSAPLEPVLSLERLHIPKGPNIISDLRLLRCARSRDSCVRIATKIRRRAWLLAFYSIDDRIGVPDCNAKLRVRRRGEQIWSLTLTKDSVSSIAFHVIATTRREVAVKLSDHLRMSPGACTASGEIPNWVDELYRHTLMTPTQVAYRRILLEKTARGFKPVAASVPPPE